MEGGREGGDGGTRGHGEVGRGWGVGRPFESYESKLGVEGT